MNIPHYVEEMFELFIFKNGVFLCYFLFDFFSYLNYHIIWALIFQFLVHEKKYFFNTVI